MIEFLVSLIVAFFAILALVAGFVILCGYRNHVEQAKYAEQQEAKRRACEERVKRERDEYNRPENVECRELLSLRDRVAKVFGVELDTVHESNSQDEIVRIVNDLACKASRACMCQSKVQRGEECVAKPRDFFHYDGYRGDGDIAWDEATSKLKSSWSSIRKFALEIAPELADRMPHFSEFEPLKSYNAEHLRQKAEKRAAK